MAAVSGQIDPQAQLILNAAAGRPSLADIVDPVEYVAAKRSGFTSQAANAIWAGGVAEAVETMEELTIETPSGAIPSRLYRGAGHMPGAILLWFHGGGFIAGDLDTSDKPMRALANQCSATIVSVGYRLAPEFPYPAAVDDAYAAVLWASNRVNELGSADGQIIVGGESAGGQLAATVAMVARDRGAPNISLQVLVYPNTDLRTGSHYDLWDEHGGKNVSRLEMDKMISLYLPEEVDALSPLLFPVLAPREYLQGLSPALVITGEFDPLRDEGETYAKRMQEAGVRVSHSRYPGMIHGFLGMLGKVDAAWSLVDQIARAVDNTC